MSSPILTAVACPYANGPRHIGHVSGFGVPSDVFSRYMRMAGHDVLMVSGTDEHGTPISVQALRQAIERLRNGGVVAIAADVPVDSGEFLTRICAQTWRWRCAAGVWMRT